MDYICSIERIEDEQLGAGVSIHERSNGDD
jgi:hypothetical protein